MIAEKMRVIPTICCNEGCSERRITAQTIVRTGCNRTAKEVCAAGRRGRANVIAIHPITWHDMANRNNHPWPGQFIVKSIGSMSNLSKGAIPTRRSPIAAPMVASNWRFAEGAWILFEYLYRIRKEE